MPAFICTACGTQYAESTSAPSACQICDDDRQFVPTSGQAWTTLERMRHTYRNSFHRLEPGLFAIRTTPAFGIDQRALLLGTEHGAVLWELVPFIDDATVEIIRALGGLSAIAISHPHYYATHVEWSRAFGDVPVHVHADDRRWISRPSSVVNFWEGETLALHDGIQLVRCGGHFPGSSVLHWPGGAGGRGVLLTGDTLHALPGGRWITVMHSYPMLVPLGAAPVRQVAQAVEPLAYERLYGAFNDREITSDAKGAVHRSIARYLEHIEPTG